MAVKQDLLLAGLAGLGIAALHGSATRGRKRKQSLHLGIKAAMGALSMLAGKPIVLRSRALNELDAKPVDLPKNSKIIDV